jgi:hypothetical protein
VSTWALITQCENREALSATVNSDTRRTKVRVKVRRAICEALSDNKDPKAWLQGFERPLGARPEQGKPWGSSKLSY